MTGNTDEPGKPLRNFLAVAGALLLVLVVRVLLVPPPSIDIADAVPVALRFEDPVCAADGLLEQDAYADKWSTHRDDGGRLLRCVSAPFQLPNDPQLLVRYAGNPDDRGLRIGLDLDADGAIDLPWALGPAARHGWLIAVVPLPAEAHGKPARLVVDDRSSRADGWVRVRDVIGFTGSERGLTGVPAWPRSLAALLAVALAAGILWYARRQHAPALALGLAALLAIEFLQASSFFLRDEYVLVGAYTNGIQWRELVSYYDQFAPLFLSLYAAAVAAAGSWYAPLQIAMLAGHLGVCLALVALLERHGFSRWLAVSIGLLYATAWSHIDVVPWFIEGCFLASTGLTLWALERTAARARGRRQALAAAVTAAALAPCVFAGGIVAPWLCLAYLAVFSPRDRAGCALFAFAGLALTGVILLGSSALDTARTVVGVASASDMLEFVARGALGSSFASLLALRGTPWLALTGFAGLSILVAMLAGARGEPARTARSLAFGALWMIAAYALQALVRTRTGFGDAMSYRYTYLGMTGAAFTVAACLQPLTSAWPARREGLRRGLIGAWIAATLAAVGANTAALQARSDTWEREYFDINRQYFALTRAALVWANTRHVALHDGLVPKTLYPGNQQATPAELTRQYREIVCYLAGCGGQARSDEQDAISLGKMRAVWDTLLSP